MHPTNQIGRGYDPWRLLCGLLAGVILATVCGAFPSQALALTQVGNTLVFPQFVNNGGYITIITLINTNFNTAVNGQLYIYNQDGSLRAAPIAGQAGNPIPVTIPPGGTVTFTTPAGGGNPISGMAKFVSDLPAGGVVQFQFSGGQIGVLDAAYRSAATLVLNTANGNDTGLAIANSSSTSSINVTLVHLDGNGNIVETISPPELNPLPPNGQVAEFAENFPFHTSLANQSSGSIQILINGSGQFNAFGLLFNGGLYASTATVLGAFQHFDPEQYQGSYTGTWNNTTFSTSGSAAASVGVDPHTQTIDFLLTLAGSVFGGSNPPPTVLSGNYDNTGFTVSGNSDLFGPVTMTVHADGTFTFTANSVPSVNVSTFTITGTAFPDMINGNYTIGLRGGGSATGTLVLNHTDQ